MGVSPSGGLTPRLGLQGGAGRGWGVGGEERGAGRVGGTAMAHTEKGGREYRFFFNFFITQ